MLCWCTYPLPANSEDVIAKVKFVLAELTKEVCNSESQILNCASTKSVQEIEKQFIL